MGINLREHLDDNMIIRKRQTFKIENREAVKISFMEAFVICDETIEDFEWLPEYDEIVDWLCDNKGKGICLAGSNGRGKSNIINSVLPLIFKAYHKKILNPYNAREMFGKRLEWAVVIDDMGQDSIVNNYGNTIDPVELAICHCEERMKPLFMSTNLTKEQILKRYGIRVLDRINRLCRIVVFKGESFRK